MYILIASLRYAIIGSCMSLMFFTSANASDCPAGLDFQVRQLASETSISLCEAYQGKVVLVVNTASQCAYTPQYKGLDELYRRYKDKGLVVLGFPSNDFAGQEPGSEQAIKKLCYVDYGVSFPMFAKTPVVGPNANEFYQHLASQTGRYPSWNFYKYLMNRDGEVVDMFSSQTFPESEKLEQAIEALL